MITHTEKLEAAISVLKSKTLIRAALEEMNATPEETAKMCAKLEAVSETYHADRKEAKIKNIVQQMAIAEITPEDLLKYLEANPVRRRRPRTQKNDPQHTAR